MAPEPGATSFTLTIPAKWEAVVQKQIGAVWPRVRVEAVVDPLIDLAPTGGAAMELKEHYALALRVDRKHPVALESLLETIQLLDQGESAVVQVLLNPATPDWWQGAVAGYESARKGVLPQKFRLDAATAAKWTLRGLAGVGAEAIGLIREFMGVDEGADPLDLDAATRAQVLRDGPLSATTAGKAKSEAFDVTIRLAVAAAPTKAAAILRALGLAFRTLDGDNSLIARPRRIEKLWLAMVQRRPPMVKISPDYLGVAEVGQLLQLPPAPLQKRFHLTAVAHRETDLPRAVTSGGLRLGVHTYRGREIPVYLPTTNPDELCLPHVVIGGMGTGKTRGFAANMAVETVRNGMGAVVIDPARGEIGDEIEAVLPPEQILRIRFGQQPIALDWREVAHSDRARNRLASEVIAFFESQSDEAGAQTIRFLRAAAKSTPSGRLSEVVKLFTDPDYRDQLIPTMRPQEQLVWGSFNALSDARQAQIGFPVLNRLDTITGDDYLNDCLDADQGIDFVELLDRPGRAIILDIPKGELGAEAVDLLTALVTTKLDLAMVMRRSQHPVWVLLDEPHQMIRSARTWRAAAVESRKWRYSYCWLFHAVEQIPREVWAIIQAAGPHYHLYHSSAATFRALSLEIAPWTVEEALRIPTHHALHLIRASGDMVPPFLALMDPPPSQAKEHSLVSSNGA